MPKVEDRVKSILSERLEKGVVLGETSYKDRITESCVAYEAAHKTHMPDMRKAVLAYSMDQLASRLKQSGVPQQYIKEAVENVGDVENPIAMMFSLVSLLVPNFAYMDVAGVQPMPTEKSPIFFQQLTAKTARNGVAANTKLLGGTGWESNNLYTTNRNKEAMTGAGTAGDPYVVTLSMKPVIPGTVRIKKGDIILKDNGAQGFTVASGTCTLGAASIDYATGAVSIVVSSGDIAGAKLDYRFDMDAGGYDPVQMVYEWATKEITAYPRRCRNIYALENYYAAKQVLKGVDIDALMSTSVAGYLNKEISCGVFDNMLDEATGSVITWDKKLPSGVSWAFHRLSILEKITAGKNAIRKNIGRGGGNILCLGTDWMNNIETLGADLWKPQKYNREPIGPYNAGVLADNFTVIKNQGFADDTGFMAYKADDTDASYMVGIFIALYNTDPLAFDDLKVRRGMGTSMGETKLFDDSIIELSVVDTTTP